MYIHQYTDTMKQKNAPAPCACTTIRKANRALFRFYEDAMVGTGISITQFSILRSLQRTGPSALSDLANTLVMERTSLYRTIAPLVEDGAVTINTGENKKIKVAALTKDGEQLIAKALPQWSQAQNQIVSAVGADQWSTLSSTLLNIPNLVSDLS
jgi:DNA-binding MarR family transcriptional regulator